MALLKEQQAAEVLGCSVALLRKHRLFRKGPAFVKIGRLVRYRSEDLDAFIEANLTTNGRAA